MRCQLFTNLSKQFFKIAKRMSEEPQIVPTEALRGKIRAYSREHRVIKRNIDTDSLRFGLGEIQSKVTELENLTEKDVQGLANRIKRRKHAGEEDLYRLTHAFLQGIENIRAFAKIPGAIQTLVKEMTGSNVEQKLHASETLCNLSLGEPPVCEKIASMAGSYLVTYLDSKEERLKHTCLWTLANIMATGGKGARYMISMKIIPKLLTLYLSDDEDPDYLEDVAVVLDVIVSSDENLLRPGDFESLFHKLHLKSLTSPASEYHLKIIFHAGFIDPTIALSEDQVSYLISFCLANLTQTEDFEGIPNRMRILYAVRVLGNLISLDTSRFNVLNEKCSVWDTKLVSVLNKIFSFKNSNLNMETLWLVKNILSCQKDSFPASHFVEHLHIPCGSLPPLVEASS